MDTSIEYINALYDKLTRKQYNGELEEIEILNNLSKAIIKGSKNKLETLSKQFESTDVIQSHLDNLIKSLVRYILFKNGKNPDVPIGKYEIQNNVIKQSNFKFNRSIPVFDILIESARIRLCKFYGFHLKLLMKKGVSEKGDDIITTDTKIYVLRSLIPNKIKMSIVKSEDILINGIIIFIISLLHANGGSMKKPKLYEFLEEVYLKQDENQIYIGAWEESVIPLMLKRRYIMKGKDNMGEETWYIAENGADEFKFDAIQKLLDKC